MTEDATAYHAGHCPHLVGQVSNGDWNALETGVGANVVRCCRCNLQAVQNWHEEPMPADEYHGPHRPEQITVYEPIDWSAPCQSR